MASPLAGLLNRYDRLTCSLSPGPTLAAMTLPAPAALPAVDANTHLPCGAAATPDGLWPMRASLLSVLASVVPETPAVLHPGAASVTAPPRPRRSCPGLCPPPRPATRYPTPSATTRTAAAAAAAAAERHHRR